MYINVPVRSLYRLICPSNAIDPNFVTVTKWIQPRCPASVFPYIRYIDSHGSKLTCSCFPYWPFDTKIHYLLTYSIEQSPSWWANWFAASQEIPRVLWNPNVPHHTQKRPSPVPNLSQPNPVHPNITLPSTPGSPQRALSIRFPHQNPVHTSPLPIRATCYVHLILFDFIIRTRLGKEYRSFSSSLYNFLHSPVTPSLLGPNILLSTLFSNTLSLHVHSVAQ
jgi:hypothetical protein